MREIHALKTNDLPSWTSGDVNLSYFNGNSLALVGYFFDKGSECLGYAVVRLFDITSDAYEIICLEINTMVKTDSVKRSILKHLHPLYKELVVSPTGDAKFYLENGYKPFTMHSGGFLFVHSGRHPKEVMHSLFGNDWSSYVPEDNFVYKSVEWEQYFKYF